MVYHVLGLMSGSSLDGLDIALVELSEIGGQWTFELKTAECVPYQEDWINKLKNAPKLAVPDFLELHTAYGRYLGSQVNEFIQKHQLQHKIHFISSHGHTAYHQPAVFTSFQLGDGASIAAVTGLTVISDLRNKDVALGGQGAPIVPVAEQLLWKEYPLCLNIGGIANLTVNTHPPLAYDICPANQVLNHFAALAGKSYDENGSLAAAGTVNPAVLAQLEQLDYYRQPAPKSLDNTYSQNAVDLLDHLSPTDALATATAHIAHQVSTQIRKYAVPESKLLITGGGALNEYLVSLIQDELPQVIIEKADHAVIEFKEAIAMALIGALRWREEENVLASVTGASKSSVGGAIWVN
ncbi:MAG: anhydro-N-acetylmuramic acid kinase [Taibaiella sp.]|nr:anhydro-N-acetylmuramic acid kinase [Taibaiella sp.]